MNVLRTFVQPKKDADYTCEDGIFVSDDFVAIVDGSTSKSERRYDGKTTGKQALDLILDALRALPRDSTMSGALAAVTRNIRAAYERYGIAELVARSPDQRFTASCVIYSDFFREVWMVGDCQCALDGLVYRNEKKIDALLSELRAYYLEAEIAGGKTERELLARDTGRAFILPAIKKQYIFQNSSSVSDYVYAAFDGFEVAMKGVRVVPVGEGVSRVVLASDGYPALKGSLEASEEYLAQLLSHDPLLYNMYRTTKGLQDGFQSFDDRSYVEFAVN